MAELDPWGQTLLDSIRQTFPWMQILGLEDFIVNLVREGATTEEILAKVRQTQQYKARFPGLVRADGTRRFATEAEYLAEEEKYREVLRKYNMWDPNQDSPFDYLAFLDSGISPEQLDQRLTLYRALERGSQDVRDAFYVYAGMRITVDDLFQAVVSPEFRQRMISTYDEAVAKQKLDYETFITRATERGLERVAETLRQMQTLGLVTGAAVSQVMNLDPDFAREMMGALFQTTGPDTRTLSVDELLAAYEYALIGSAATEAGFELPTRERLEEFRSMGVDRARALRGYRLAALREAGLASMAERFNFGDVTQVLLERAFVANEAGASADVTRLFQQESALGRTGLGFNRTLEGNRVVQQGRSLR
ncbi:MAG TPA: hypothetical protein VF377_08910 [Acidimicrobiia bacterium]